VLTWNYQDIYNLREKVKNEVIEMKSVNPATGEIIAEFKEHSPKDVEKIINQVHNRFLSWKETSFKERAKLMNQVAKVLRKNKTRYAETMAKEMGKAIVEGEGEVEKCAWVCEHYAENAEKYLEPEIIKSDASKSYVRNDPIGIVLAVMPWNFPLWQVFRFAAPGLMAGNVGVLKHASNVMGCAIDIENVFKEAGFPDDCFRSLLIGSKQVEAVIRNPLVKAVTLTGSTPAGKMVASTAGSEIKKTVLELGGSDPFIVLKDADIPKTCAGAAAGRFLNSGQSCIAAKRFIVVKEKVEEFEQLYKELTEAKVMGDPLDRNTNMGPMARVDLMEELDIQVQDSIKKGARVVTGAKRGEHAFYHPTILADVKKGMPVYDEETFGPVAAIIPVKDEEEAIKVANDTEFGLGASIWTKDTKHAQEIARRIDAGAVFINGIVKSDPRLPFGGTKLSGYGRELSYHGIKEFCNQKTIWVK
jgi:succinate-semialdehyde dehydrogenase / glutarate-semialdehyde dehydrogenase